MKKILLSAMALMAFSFASAQETSNVPTNSNGFRMGDFFVTGSVGVGSQSTGDNKSNSFNISPRVGYFLMDNIAVGAALGYESGKTKSPGEPDFKQNEFSIGVFGRYYVTPATGFSLFGQLGLDYIHATSEWDVPGAPKNSSNAFQIGLAPGVNYFVSSNFALEATFGILSFRTDSPDEGDNTDNFNLGLNFTNINLGLIYRF